jgi:hypothetical protein
MPGGVLGRMNNYTRHPIPSLSFYSNTLLQTESHRDFALYIVGGEEGKGRRIEWAPAEMSDAAQSKRIGMCEEHYYMSIIKMGNIFFFAISNLGPT